jgi:FtsH-binding integral membrane protein
VANAYALAGQFLVGAVLLGSASLAYEFTPGVSTAGQIVSAALWSGAVGAGLVCAFTFNRASSRRRTPTREDMTGDESDISRAVDAVIANNALAHQCERGLLAAVAIPTVLALVAMALARVAPSFASGHVTSIISAFFVAGLIGAASAIFVLFDWP